MSRAVITKSLLTAIANAIRAKTGKSAQLTPAQMATEIAAIPSGDVPAWLYNPNAQYPASYTWPYSTMRPHQLYNQGYAQHFFETLDLGSVTDLPEYALAALTSGTTNSPLSHVVAHQVRSIGNYALSGNSNLVQLDAPLVTTIGNYALTFCTKLATLNVPELLSLGQGALSNAGLTSLVAPKLTSLGSSCLEKTQLTTFEQSNLTTLGGYSFGTCRALERAVLGGTYTSTGTNMFYMCTALRLVDLQSQSITMISNNTFYQCSALESLVIRKQSAVVSLATTNALANSGIAKGTGYIYVPDEWLETYKKATNWATYAAQIRPLSEYVEEDPT